MLFAAFHYTSTFDNTGHPWNVFPSELPTPTPTPPPIPSPSPTAILCRSGTILCAIDDRFDCGSAYGSGCYYSGSGGSGGGGLLFACVPGEFCNGVPECPDGSDEFDCPGTVAQEPYRQLDMGVGGGWGVGGGASGRREEVGEEIRVHLTGKGCRCLSEGGGKIVTYKHLCLVFLFFFF